MAKHPARAGWRWVVALCACIVVVVSAGQRAAAQRVSAGDAVRFLEQATFGPPPELIAQV